MASEVTKRLRDRRKQIWEEIKVIAETAAAENRNFTPEEQGRWEVANEDMDNLDKKIKSALEAEKRSKETDAAFDAITRRKPELRGGDGASHADSTGRDLNAELRAMLGGERGAPRAVEVGHNGPFGSSELRTLLNSGSPTAVIPTDFYDRVIAHLIEVSGILQAGPTLLNTSGGEILQIPKTTAHSTAAVATASQAIPTADPAFAQVTLSAYKYGILLSVARELIDDSSVDLLGYLAMQAGRAVGNAFGSDLVLGAGAGHPSGLISAISASPAVTGPVPSAVTGALSAQNITVGGPSYFNLVDMQYSVIAPYRQSRSCYWMMRDASVAALRKLTDTNGRPVWEPSTVLGSPDLLLGKPVVADPFVQALATNAFPVLFGDFAQFFVRLVGGVRFERSDDFQFGTDLVTFRALLRGDGVLADTNAIKAFKGG